ncbi:hypothetical protein AB0M91_24080 [Micromonospora rifamycinica]|uniref:hypothetical protein n=1 Tax=Micromonospora rifamycinica TaxID=291594 RepID=UPI0034224E38
MVDDAVMRIRRWVIFGVGVLVAAGLAVAALLFGLKGVEVASWLAGSASLVVAIAAIGLTRPGPAARAPALSPGSQSVSAGGDISGIVSTGDHTTNTQHR